MTDRSRCRSDAGFTLIEILVTLVIGSILMAISVWGMHSYLVASRESGTASDIRSALRSAGEHALSEGRTYCVYFTSSQWTVYKASCTTATPANKVVGPLKVQDRSLTLTGVSFAAPATPVPNQTTSCPSTGKCAYFYPRGTSLTGSLVVSRPSGKTYRICVQGLTARVWIASGSTCG
ncbi:MAG: GspH/FimT family pseudopilin [Mycobacteriales bacterium]